MSITATAIITTALANDGIIGVGETPTAAMLADGLSRLDSLLEQWRTQYLVGPFQSRQVFSTVANQSTYTIGPTGNWATTKPQEITGAGLLLKSVTPYVEIPRTVLTDDAYEAIQIKTLTSTLFTAVYFNFEYANDLATVFLWPTPTTNQNDVVLYSQDLIVGFGDLTTARVMPAGYSNALEWNLAEEILAPYGVQDASIVRKVEMKAARTLANIKRQNVSMSDLSTDPIWTNSRKGGYNIQTGNM